MKKLTIKEAAKLKEFKVEVTPEQSKKLQLELFKHNIRWYDGTAKVVHTDKPYLYVSRGKLLSYGESKNNFYEDYGIRVVLVDEEDAGAHYRFSYKGINLDPFRIAKIYGMQSFAMMTILKKCLCAGKRGHKNYVQDLKDIINAAQRELEIIKEDTFEGEVK